MLRESGIGAASNAPKGGFQNVELPSKPATAGTLIALTAVSATARADDLVQHLGPVGPHEPILTCW